MLNRRKINLSNLFDSIIHIYIYICMHTHINSFDCNYNNFLMYALKLKFNTTHIQMKLK